MHQIYFQSVINHFKKKEAKGNIEKHLYRKTDLLECSADRLHKSTGKDNGMRRQTLGEVKPRKSIAQTKQATHR